MPYRHAGEIGDIWKHLPLCEVLGIEAPRRYYETNAASALHVLAKSEETEYGIAWVLAHGDLIGRSKYLDIIRAAQAEDPACYPGSPAQAMRLLGARAQYCFYDMEQPALDNIAAYARRLGLLERTALMCADSIGAYLAEKHELTPEDLLFIDPYAPFDTNPRGQSFFDVFAWAVNKGVRTVMWYGYDNLPGQRRILERLRAIAAFGAPIHAFDAWQHSMGEDGCPVNPGVPGCGMALANVSPESIEAAGDMLARVQRCYERATYGQRPARLLTKASAFAP